MSDVVLVTWISPSVSLVQFRGTIVPLLWVFAARWRWACRGTGRRRIA